MVPFRTDSSVLSGPTGQKPNVRRALPALLALLMFGAPAAPAYSKPGPERFVGVDVEGHLAFVRSDSDQVVTKPLAGTGGIRVIGLDTLPDGHLLGLLATGVVGDVDPSAGTFTPRYGGKAVAHDGVIEGASTFSVSPDGRSVLVAGAGHAERIDLSTGDATPVAFPAYAPDGPDAGRQISPALDTLPNGTLFGVDAATGGVIGQQEPGGPMVARGSVADERHGPTRFTLAPDASARGWLVTRAAQHISRLVEVQENYAVDGVEVVLRDGLDAAAAVGPATEPAEFADWPAVARDAAGVVSYYRGTAVWSAREQGGSAGSPRYALMAILPGSAGGVTRLPVAPRAGVPFDVDLGPGAHGHVTAVYSRCRREPAAGGVTDSLSGSPPSRPYPAWTSARGCDLYSYDFVTKREAKVRGASTKEASEMLPSIWKDHIAFVRVYPHAGHGHSSFPYMYVRRIGLHTHSIRQPGGSRGVDGLPGPTRLDLYGSRLAFVWNLRTGRGAGRSLLRLDTVGRGHRALSSQSWKSDDYATFLGPTGSDGRIYYGYEHVRAASGASLTSVTSLLERYRLSTRTKDLADSPGPLLDLAHDASVTFLATAPGFASAGPAAIRRHAGALGWR